MKKTVILASKSKKRSDILRSCGIAHMVMPSEAFEIHPVKKDVPRAVVANARTKALKIAVERKDISGAVIIGADTLVVHRNHVIGKPKSESEAKGLLKKFSGSDIDVYTGIFVIDRDTKKHASCVDKSSIRVKKITAGRIDDYFKKLGSYDKAGGFSIEGVGSMIFDNIKGSYFNILGLPTGKLSDLFAKVGLDILEYCG
jgi:septum formation protein